MLESVHLFLHLNLVYHQCIIKTGLALGNGKKEKIYCDIADQKFAKPNQENRLFLRFQHLCVSNGSKFN